jgi:hypothetical protein
MVDVFKEVVLPQMSPVPGRGPCGHSALLSRVVPGTRPRTAWVELWCARCRKVVSEDEVHETQAA